MHPPWDGCLQKTDDERILDAHEINRLVRRYFSIDSRPQASEEWWAGAVALDHFLAGLLDFAGGITASRSQAQHRSRAWVVNT